MAGDIDKIDLGIGERIKAARQARRLSLVQLASSIGVSYQQVQKYENGQSRTSAAMLYRISLALQRDVVSFFPDGSGQADTAPALSMTRIEPDVRAHLVALLEAMARDAEKKK